MPTWAIIIMKETILFIFMNQIPTIKNLNRITKPPRIVGHLASTIQIGHSEFLAYGSGGKNTWIGPNIAANVSSMTKLISPHHDAAWPARSGLNSRTRITRTDRFHSDIPRRTGMTPKQRFDRLPSQYFDLVWYTSIELIKDWEGSPRNFIDSVQKHRTGQIGLLNKKNFIICVRYHSVYLFEWYLLFY